MLLLKLILSLCADRPRTLLSVLHYTLYRFLGIIREEILGFLIKLDEEGLSVQWWGKKDDWLWLLISFSSSRRRNQTWTLNVTQHSAVDRKLNQKHLKFFTASWQNQAVLGNASWLKLKLFGVLVASDVVVSVRKLFTETTKYLAAKMSNSFCFNSPLPVAQVLTF